MSDMASRLRCTANIAADADLVTKLLPATREFLREAASEVETLQSTIDLYASALKWAIEQEDDHYDRLAFLEACRDGSALTDEEWGEFRYWAGLEDNEGRTIKQVQF